jgi:uncharacterized membrane protein
MTFYVLALLIGVIAGLRAMTAPAAVSWAAHLGWLPVANTPLAFMGWAYTPYIFTVLAIVEFVTDQLPQTPSRKVPQQFGARIISGALCGATLGMALSSLLGSAVSSLFGGLAGSTIGELMGIVAGGVSMQIMAISGLVAGIVGAVIGTLGGAAARGALARSFGRDLPAALIEDVVAVVGAYFIVSAHL